MFGRRKRERFGPQETYNGCVGCSNWAKPVHEHVCCVEGCEAAAQGALMSYLCTSPGVGSRRWFYLCPEHDRELHRELVVNVGGDGPFDQDIRLRMFTPESV